MTTESKYVCSAELIVSTTDTVRASRMPMTIGTSMLVRRLRSAFMALRKNGWPA
jgi:hypothetical protein